MSPTNSATPRPSGTERLGAAASVWHPIAGGQAGTFTYVLTFDDLAAYGAFGTAMSADEDWMTWWMNAQADPTGAPVETVLAGEVLQA